MIADVQSWLDSPANNFGWLILGDESGIATAKRFDTRESTDPPVLAIQYVTGHPTPTPTLTPTVIPNTDCYRDRNTNGYSYAYSFTFTNVDADTYAFFPSAPLSACKHQCERLYTGLTQACVQILDGPCTNMWTYGGTYPLD